MELANTEPIFKFIEELKTYFNDNEIILKFLNFTDWTESEFNNLTNSLRNNYPEVIEDEFLEISASGDNYLKIFKIANILNYCNTNNYKNTTHEFGNKTIIKTENFNDLFDVNLTFEISKKSISDNNDWVDTQLKKFRLIKIFSYDLGHGIIAKAKIMKYNEDKNSYFPSLKKSKILSLPQRYEFEINISNTSNLLSSIIIIIKSIFLSNIVLTKKQQLMILEDYTNLVKKNMDIPHYFKDIPLLTPKPSTLELINLGNPDDYGGYTSILKNYAVTEKADGERMLLFINDKGKVYLISSSLKVEDTGIIASKDIYNSLIDGEYVSCHKRIDKSNKNLFASFDIYYLNNKCLTSLPLIANPKNDSRNDKMLSIKKFINTTNSDIEFIIKNHRNSSSILNDCNEILSNPHNFPYEIDGLIFTPANLAVYSYYPSIPIPITQNMSWEKLFKWKPPEQNTIDFLIKLVGDVKKNGITYRQYGLYVGSNPITTKDLSIEEALKLRYDRNYFKEHQFKMKEMIKNKEDFIPILFKPVIYYYPDVEFAYLKIDSKGEVRAENNDKIETDTIVECRYNIEEKRWIPIRVREDKTKIFKKGIFTKTANSLPVAINVWRSIHNPISMEMITGKARKIEVSNEIEGKVLEADDVYYSRGIPRRFLLSFNMITFHNVGVNEMLYSKAKQNGTLLELACGQGSDLARWISANFKFVLGLDLAKDNIYKANDGALARLLKEYSKFNKIKKTEKSYFPNIIFAAADCTKDIKSGDAGVDDDSKELIRIIMNNTKNVKTQYKYIAGIGANQFDTISCLFAIHYFFQNEETLNGFLNNVSVNLKKGGHFNCTFMDSEMVMKYLNEGDGKMIEGRKKIDDDDILIWAIIKRFEDNHTSYYNKKIDVFIENTKRLITEYLVDFNFLKQKAKEFDLEIYESELYVDTFNKFKENIPDEERKQSSFDKILLNLDKEDIQKKLSFINRWAIFKKI
jgi:hypothetical protein